MGRLRLPPGGAGLRRCLTPLAAGCFALVARPYLYVLSTLFALASFARFLGSPESAQHFLGLGARGTRRSPGPLESSQELLDEAAKGISARLEVVELVEARACRREEDDIGWRSC